MSEIHPKKKNTKIFGDHQADDLLPKGSGGKIYFVSCFHHFYKFMILSNISVKADFPGQDESHTDNLTMKTTSSNKMARHTLPAALVPGTEHVSAVRKHEFSDTGSRTGWRDLTSFRSHDTGPRGSHLRVLFESPVKFWVRINTNSSYCYHQECDMRIAAMSAHRDSKSGYYKSGSGA